MNVNTPQRVKIVEVGARDGLQNEARQLTTQDKVALIEKLVAAGMQTVEVGAMVSPKWVPQMADSAEVYQQITPQTGVHYPVLVPNLKGYLRAKAIGVAEISVFIAASESFSKKNINCSIAESLQMVRTVIAAARADGVAVRGYVSCVMGCPYEGKIAPQAVLRVSQALLEAGVYEVSLGDTIGVGTPRQTEALLRVLLAEMPATKLAAHFHDTYGQALANTLVALEAGMATVDTSVAGLGGCPYAKGASGNLASEELLYMLDGMGIPTGVDLEALVSVGDWVSQLLGRKNQSKVGRAMLAKRA